MIGNNKGFTLLEIVIVLVILGVFAALGFRSFSGGGSATDLAQAEDIVIAELRKARSRAVHRLPPSNDPDAAQVADLEGEIGALNDRLGTSMEVCPVKVRFTVGDASTRSVKEISCDEICEPCDEGKSEYRVSLTPTEGDPRIICLNGQTGRVDRAPCN
ncbi:pilus assembly FimT family protein [Spiribacter vilamensis]|uniref:Prepilin-type N-terminal cleavage/methylation domain-containing protein n=1 Tax=Spiribacter vilamensis TaxID=531306 RepID=A0A4Q8CZZ4_9GAMM|nr:type II secretion system protein [Spiribacter vilamensis]RZU98608.1 prepilin-type N-terminal cleavage/methylation domain-containing protein [Spiribacter vilamensis]TVO60134.1 type II secretion system protein [Spiribacter vilamensis]